MITDKCQHKPKQWCDCDGWGMEISMPRAYGPSDQVKTLLKPQEATSSSDSTRDFDAIVVLKKLIALKTG